MTYNYGVHNLKDNKNYNFLCQTDFQIIDDLTSIQFKYLSCRPTIQNKTQNSAQLFIKHISEY